MRYILWLYCCQQDGSDGTITCWLQEEMAGTSPYPSSRYPFNHYPQAIQSTDTTNNPAASSNSGHPTPPKAGELLKEQRQMVETGTIPHLEPREIVRVDYDGLVERAISQQSNSLIEIRRKAEGAGVVSTPGLWSSVTRGKTPRVHASRFLAGSIASPSYDSKFTN